MRMIDADKEFAALAHLPLRVKQIFGRGFIRNEGIARDIAKAINRAHSLTRPAHQTATLFRLSLARVRVHLFDMRSLQRNHFHFVKAASGISGQGPVIRFRPLSPDS